MILVRFAHMVGAQRITAPSWLAGLLLVGVAALGVYAALTWGPRGIGPAFLRLDPDGEVTAGLRLTVHVVLQPRERLVLDPLRVRLFARTAGDKGELVYARPDGFARPPQARHRRVLRERSARGLRVVALDALDAHGGAAGGPDLISEKHPCSLLLVRREPGAACEDRGRPSARSPCA